MPKREMADGAELRALLEAHGLATMRGYKQVANWLYVKPNTVQHYLQRGCLRVYLNYVEMRIARRRVRKRKENANS